MPACLRSFETETRDCIKIIEPLNSEVISKVSAIPLVYLFQAQNHPSPTTTKREVLEVDFGKKPQLCFLSIGEGRGGMGTATLVISADNMKHWNLVPSSLEIAPTYPL